MKVLVIAAHSDDEALGCGGTLARHASAGDTVRCIFMTDGVGAREGSAAYAEGAQRRRKSAIKAATLLGAGEPRMLDFPDNQLDTVPLLGITQAIEAEVRAYQPEIVYTHHGGDLNVDHRLVAQATLTALRPLPGSCVRAIYGFEVASSTEWAAGATGPGFNPRRAVDIRQYLARKIEAVAAYEEEVRAFPHPRSPRAIEALAVWRGASFGLEAAEAFTVYREILK
jgi:N-acetylglucosamine malate deacetylase 1